MNEDQESLPTVGEEYEVRPGSMAAQNWRSFKDQGIAARGTDNAKGYERWWLIKPIPEGRRYGRD